MSTLNVNRIVDASGGVFAPVSSVFRSRIINGGMVIDQRNAGASVTANGSYPVDRYQYQNDSDATVTLQQSSTAPAGFVNSLSATISTADASVGATQYSVFTQRIEGFNVADLGWGTANAKTVTLSFWVRASVTGTYGGAINNDGSSRSYPYTYTINSANTWEYKTITIAGDTTGTWLTTNGVGVQVRWSLGMGSSLAGTAGSWSGSTFFGATGAVNLISTSGATLFLTGVQLEVGTQATSFEYRQYGTELALCQRYFQIVALNLYNGNPGANEYYSVPIAYLAQMRATPTAGTISGGTQINLFFSAIESLAPMGARFTIGSSISADAGYIDAQAPLSAEL
jgi:hypothetical protein